MYLATASKYLAANIEIIYRKNAENMGDILRKFKVSDNLKLVCVVSSSFHVQKYSFTIVPVQKL